MRFPVVSQESSLWAGASGAPSATISNWSNVGQLTCGTRAFSKCPICGTFVWHLGCSSPYAKSSELCVSQSS